MCQRMRTGWMGVAAVIVLSTTTAWGAFDITVNFGAGLTASQQAIFAQAEATWEGLITDYKPGVNLPGITITASGPYLDGVGGTLGQAGPQDAYMVDGWYYTKTGIMQFDSADLGSMETNGSLLSVITHEMAHVIGFGILWTYNGLYTDDTGEFTGANALAAYKTEFNKPTATYVPVELEGGDGTANAHWNEVVVGAGNTGIVDSLGRDMKNELMTGWLNSPTFISNTTVQSFADLGYVVVPEPAALSALAVGALLLARRRAA